MGNCSETNTVRIVGGKLKVCTQRAAAAVVTSIGIHSDAWVTLENRYPCFQCIPMDVDTAADARFGYSFKSQSEPRRFNNS